MKFFIGLTLLTSSLLANAVSINPERTITPFVEIFSTANNKISDSEMQVSVSTYTKTGDIIKGKGKLNMPMPDYVNALKLSRAVFQMTPHQQPKGHSDVSGDKMVFDGTAFHIGENLVLTNQHVLSPDRTNTTECKDFQLKANETGKNIEFYPCKKVHYCNSKLDVCLIEMSPRKICLNSFCTKKKYVEMKSGEALKLKKDTTIPYTEAYQTLLSCIGNTMGKGIHFSQGRGADALGDLIYFYAPLRSGNSGGPVIGEDNLVWGVVRQESKKKVASDAFNVALSSTKVISLMQEQLTDLVVLEKFNKAIQE